MCIVHSIPFMSSGVTSLLLVIFVSLVTNIVSLTGK